MSEKRFGWDCPYKDNRDFCTALLKPRICCPSICLFGLSDNIDEQQSTRICVWFEDLLRYELNFDEDKVNDVLVVGGASYDLKGCCDIMNEQQATDLVEDLKKSDDEFAKRMSAWLEAMLDEDDKYDSCDWFNDDD